ncbi:aminotransferase class I/II-fold pyridoxal phosphate-dependent enzyme [Pontibacter sp. JH31]|uniref:Aminotransferase class I/II-fold pyridoxal phosphate-dependent enzyme n=1 Tax=Pontibacter aquaedesilientis TaxID=2766980 RepID=A0ABR7XH71_9BACT|nr:aminotransferase class I/II-fold pyridoxal phosphate-dependent enzyme [Pontibacter aquaedesilientis]MBD1397611.1 aminotransferase class I/II-fold pyridoxal phosphate-dependent enzyme [Pontibacter aquaedesilientis]
MKKTLLSAKDVPYYASLFSEIQFNPNYDFNSLEDLQRIPLLKKEIIKKDYRHFVNPKYKGVAVEYSTSGSTGEPMKMLLSPYMVAIDKAMIFRHTAWSTSKSRPKIFSLRSYVRESEHAPFFKKNALENNVYYSAYDLDNKNADEYVRQLIDYNPDIIRGYPSSINHLADFISHHDVTKLTNLKGIYTSSESLTSSERENIEGKFGRILFNWYGMTEPAIIIKECANHHGMHVCLEYGYPEYQDTDYAGIKSLVTTSYYNEVMPFIRYETGDLVELSAQDEPACSQTNLPMVKNVIGRKDEHIVGKDGAKLPSINFYTLFRDFTKVKAFQLVQFSSLEVLALVRTDAPLLPSEKEDILNLLRQRIGNEIPIYLKETEEFYTNSDGKTLVIIKKPGTYKLSNFDEYTLSTQKAWGNYREGQVAYKLDWNEADLTPATGVSAHLSKLLATDHYVKWYPETNHAALLNKLVDYTKVPSADFIMLAHGSDSGIRLVLQTFSTGKDKVVITSPTYDNFRAQCESFGNEIVAVDLRNAHEESLQKLMARIKEQEPRFVYLCNPNNPIGYSFTNSQIAQVLDLCTQLNSILIVDEAYFEFRKISATELLPSDNLIIIRTFSKAFGLAGLRLGYVLSSPAIIKELGKINNPKDVTMLGVEAGIYSLDNFNLVDAYVDEVNRNKEIFYEHCKQNNIEYYESDANFVSYKVENIDSYIQHMDTAHVYIRDRRKYFNDNFVRITIGGNESFNVFIEKHNSFLLTNKEHTRSETADTEF